MARLAYLRDELHETGGDDEQRDDFRTDVDELTDDDRLDLSVGVCRYATARSNDEDLRDVT